MSDNSEFAESMKRATEQMILNVKRNMVAACLVVEAEAKKSCPVDTGITRAMISHNVSITTEGIVGTIGCNAEIAPYVHQGTGIYAINGDGRKTPWGYESKAGKYKGFHWTRGQRPQPFLEDAKIKNIGRISSILGGK